MKVDSFLLAQNQNFDILLVSNEKYLNLTSGLETKFSFVSEEFINTNKINFIPLLIRDKIYFGDKKGGNLFKMDSLEITKVDNSINYNAFNHISYASLNDDLFAIGGYGFFNAKSIVQKFNFENGDWELFTTLNDDYFGFVDGISVSDEMTNKIYYLNNSIRDNTTDKNIDNKYFHLININGETQKISFDYDKFNLNTKRVNYNYFQNSGKLFYGSQYNLHMLDFTRNIYEVYERSELFSESIFPVFYSESHFVSFVKNKSRPGYVNIARREAFPKFLYSSKIFPFPYRKYIYLTALIFASLVIYKIFFGSKFILLDDHLKKGRLKVYLDKDQKNFLNKLIEEGEIRNSHLISYFDSGKSYDLSIKKKNSFIDEFNQKLYSKFKKVLIVKESSNKDKRQSIYKLAIKVTKRA